MTYLFSSLHPIRTVRSEAARRTNANVRYEVNTMLVFVALGGLNCYARR